MVLVEIFSDCAMQGTASLSLNGFPTVVPLPFEQNVPFSESVDSKGIWYTLERRSDTDQGISFSIKSGDGITNLSTYFDKFSAGSGITDKNCPTNYNTTEIVFDIPELVAVNFSIPFRDTWFIYIRQLPGDSPPGYVKIHARSTKSWTPILPVKSPNSAPLDTGVVVGAIFGGVAGVVLVVGLVLYLRRRQYLAYTAV